MMNGLYYGHMYEWGLGSLMMLVFWIAAILLIVWAIRGFRRDDSGHPRPKSALDILKDRYAKGEIDKKEFEEKKKDLIE